MNEQTTMKTTEVCSLLCISRNTLYQKLKDPEHPVTRARIKGLKPYRFKRATILDYVGAEAE